MSGDCFLAFDTSCYTTSAAVVSDGQVLFDKRIALEVERGGRGLRQSEAVFQHIKNIKSIFLESPMKKFNIKAAAFSEKPRPSNDSYMPVFCAGESFALACAGAMGVKHYALTHQHGHLYSAFFGNKLDDGIFCAFHVSGGTLELLQVQIQDNIVTGIEQKGGTLDITCGQLIDRVGVAAGLAFPAGAEMEKRYSPGGAKLTVSVSGMNANLSGAEAQALRLLREGADTSFVFGGVIDCVAETLVRLLINAAQETGIKKFVFTGGVICNKIIREYIQNTCSQIGYECIMAGNEYSGDNACGLALAAQILYNKEKCIEDN